MPFRTQKRLLKPKHLIYHIITFQTSGYAPTKVKMSNEASHLTSPLTQPSEQGMRGGGSGSTSREASSRAHPPADTYAKPHGATVWASVTPPSFPNLQILNTNIDGGSVHHVPGPGGEWGPDQYLITSSVCRPPIGHEPSRVQS